jgi:methyltransferase (TIGR00027 family)
VGGEQHSLISYKKKQSVIPAKPSHTAFRTALKRAAHQLLDSPLVFEDRLALPILGPEQEAALRADPHQFEQSKLAPYLRAFLAVRSRVAEETLAQCVAAGVRQYVILGAGLDTFAFRNSYPLSALRVFEVDHPATQAWKRGQLEQADIPMPGNLTFVPIDFERQNLSQELLSTGFNPEAGAFFSWLGVMPYLQPEAARETLRAIASLSGLKGGVVFDYAIPVSSLGLMQRLLFKLMAARVKAAGEPWLTFCYPSDLARELSGMGFRYLEDLSGDLLNQRYFADRADGLRVGTLYHLMKALISPLSNTA